MADYRIFTDGSCLKNPGPGGWAAIVRNAKGYESELSGGMPDTTNNIMELMGAIEGLRAIPEGSSAELYTDSQYVVKGITEWLAGWKRRGWKNAAKDPVANREYWERLDALASTRKVSWHWVKGHAGHAENERADALAQNAARNI
ncbi:MAG: ribonuclease HI [Alphaproteobacteria bacterium]|nr:ribonuclease HI [Alphaproteobacteria bacterium]